MAKFKVGQWVRRVKPSDWPQQFGEVGKLYKVLRADDFGNVSVIAGENSMAGAFEPWQPKVGERVRMVKDGMSTTGAVGKAATLEAWSNGTFVDWTGDYLLNIDPPIDYKTQAVTPKYTRAKIDCFEPLPANAEATPAARFKIQAGKCYRARDGRKVGPMEIWASGEWHAPSAGSPLDGGVWLDHGAPKYVGAKDSPDLIAEWVEEAPVKAIVSAQSDAISDEYGPAVKAEPAPKFKVGDRVVLLPGVVMSAKAGATATVGPKGLYGEYVDICWDRDNLLRNAQSDGGYYQSNFRLLEPTTTTTAIVCLIENGQPKPATRPFVHPSREAAIKEAKRLADKHVGQEFGVYILADSITTKPTYAHEWQRLAVNGNKIGAIKELRSLASLDLASAKKAVETFLEKEPYLARAA